MEEGVVNRLLTSNIGKIFDKKSLVTDISGSGNNFAHGYYEYGNLYHQQISNTLRRCLEQCSSPEGFICTFSLGGGTGSGLGSYTMEIINDQYPELLKFASVIFPQMNSGTDVVTSPYNTILALKHLQDCCDSVMPVSNDALARIVGGDRPPGPVPGTVTGTLPTKTSKKNFDSMNGIVAQSWLDLTASMRFPGSLNVDLSDITTNMVPFLTNKFLIPALAPVTPLLKDLKYEPRNFDQLFTDVMSPAAQLIAIDPRKGINLAQTFICRGENISIAHVIENIERLKKSEQSLKNRPEYLQYGYKLGICSSSVLGVIKKTVFGLSNTTAISPLFIETWERFRKLYKRKAHVHHYLEYMEPDMFMEGVENLQGLINSYSDTVIVNREVVKGRKYVRPIV
jgi:tubulin epsilon